MMLFFNALCLYSYSDFKKSLILIAAERKFKVG